MREYQVCRPSTCGAFGLSSLFCSYSSLDVNECATGFHRCGPNSVCVNLLGSYRCECRSGYEFADDRHTCICECPPVPQDAQLFALWLYRRPVAWFSRRPTTHMGRTQSYGSVQSCVLGFCFCLGFCCCCCIVLFIYLNGNFWCKSWKDVHVCQDCCVAWCLAPSCSKTMNFSNTNSSR